jgi:hypothetical protein
MLVEAYTIFLTPVGVLNYKCIRIRTGAYVQERCALVLDYW